MAPHWSAEKWTDVLSKGGGQKKRFQYCLKPDHPQKILYLRAIQVHSRKAYSGNARVNPVLQDNVLLPKDFTKYLSRWKRKGIEIVRNGLVPEDSALQQAYMPYSLPLWTRWLKNRA